MYSNVNRLREKKVNQDDRERRYRDGVKIAWWSLVIHSSQLLYSSIEANETMQLFMDWTIIQAPQRTPILQGINKAQLKQCWI